VRSGTPFGRSLLPYPPLNHWPGMLIPAAPCPQRWPRDHGRRYRAEPGAVTRRYRAEADRYRGRASRSMAGAWSRGKPWWSVCRPTVRAHGGGAWWSWRRRSMVTTADKRPDDTGRMVWSRHAGACMAEHAGCMVTSGMVELDSMVRRMPGATCYRPDCAWPELALAHGAEAMPERWRPDDIGDAGLNGPPAMPEHGGVRPCDRPACTRPELASVAIGRLAYAAGAWAQQFPGACCQPVVTAGAANHGTCRRGFTERLQRSRRSGRAQ
jgi:hypothetical protein